MPRLTNARVAAQIQRETEEFFYSDTASLLHDTVSSLDGYGQPVVSTSTTSIECSYTDKPSMERWKDYVDVTQINAEVRFSTPTPQNGDRITITGMYDGSGFVDKTFEIIGIKDRDVFGYVCALKAVSA